MYTGPGVKHLSTGSHYDRITGAWRLVMGESFHYGLFETDEARDPAAHLNRATVRLNEHLLGSGGLSSGAQVLDLGCGIGGPARWLARQVGAEVVGVSNSAAGVAEATRLSEGVPAVRFVHADALHTGLPDASFDVAWVMESSHLMPDKPGLFAEVRRILRPGGWLLLCDLMVPAPIPLADVFAMRDDFNCLDRVFGRARMETLQTYEQLASDAGLEVHAADDLTASTRPTFGAWANRARAHQEELVELLGADGLQDLLRGIDILARFWDEGRMGYGMLRARSSA
jgi:27-O-demethylrifamycin SV methyltransferase